MIELVKGVYWVCGGCFRCQIGNRKYTTTDPDCRNSGRVAEDIGRDLSITVDGAPNCGFRYNTGSSVSKLRLRAKLL